MAEKKDKPTISFRADEETKKKFDEMSEEFGNRNLFIQTLLNLYSMDKAGATLAGQETSIKNFQSLVNKLVEEYVYSLELTANAENRVRTDFELQLDNKELFISDLQTKLSEAKQATEQTELEIENLKEQLQKQSETITTATENVQQLQARLASSETIIEQQKIIIEGKDKNIVSLTEEKNSFKEKIEKAETIQSENETLRSQLEALRQEYENYKKQIELEKQTAERERQNERQTAELQKQAEIARAVANERTKAIAETQNQTQLQISSLSLLINQLLPKQENTKKISKNSEPEVSAETENVEEVIEGQFTFDGEDEDNNND